MPRLVAEDIALVLKKRILSGEWAESGRMPPERDLAGAFGVARNTMRRAVGLLEENGMVVRHVGRGTFLTTTDDNSLVGAIARMEGAGPADIMEVRRLLEPTAAAFAATNGSASELSAVREAHQAAIVAKDMPAFERWDAAFHERIFFCSRNELLKEIHNLVRILRNQAPWFEMKRRSFSEEHRRAYCNEHQAVLDALLIRDPRGASGAMYAHLQTVARNLLGDHLVPKLGELSERDASINPLHS
jgi:DNA-binding FadR family transcriptional regulator